MCGYIPGGLLPYNHLIWADSKERLVEVALQVGPVNMAQNVSLHCEKSLFVLATRQKIPVLRTENPAVDTSTFCLLPIEFF